MYSGILLKKLSVQSSSQNKIELATGIALLIHVAGLIGMIWADKQWFARMTPLNLLLMLFLIIWIQENKNKAFYLFFAGASLIGLFTEVIGVNTGMLFGNYSYGPILGAKIAGVPLIIGLNWFVVLYCAIATLNFLSQNFIRKNNTEKRNAPSGPIDVNLVIAGAFVATFFDWIMEPVAISLGFWAWAGDGQIPIFNYLTWFCISLFMLSLFRFTKSRPENIFAVRLFLIQLIFFILLRVFL